MEFNYGAEPRLLLRCQNFFINFLAKKDLKKAFLKVKVVLAATSKKNPSSTAEINEQYLFLRI